jgi:hypothetical protein
MACVTFTVQSALGRHKVRRFGGSHWRRGHGDDEGPSGSDPAPRSSTALVEILEVVEAESSVFSAGIQVVEVVPDGGGFRAAGASDPTIRRTCCVAVRGALVGFGNGFVVEVDDGFVGFSGFCAGAGAITGFVVDGFEDLLVLGPGAGVGIADNGWLSE